MCLVSVAFPVACTVRNSSACVSCCLGCTWDVAIIPRLIRDAAPTWSITERFDVDGQASGEVAVTFFYLLYGVGAASLNDGGG